MPKLKRKLSVPDGRTDPNYRKASPIKILIIFVVRVWGLPWVRKSAAHYQVQLGLSDKCRAIKRLFDCSTFCSHALYWIGLVPIYYVL